MDNASSAFRTLSALKIIDVFPPLSPEKQNEITSYLQNPILIENAYRNLQDNIAESSQKEGENMISAYWAFQSFFPLLTAKDYLRTKGKKIDEERFAKEALNPDKKIPPRPEQRGF